MTILLAWINVKYKHNYETIFLLTAILDIFFMTMLIRIFG